MKRSRFNWLPLAVLLAAAGFTAGCDTYHYYDIKVSFGTVTEEEAGVLQVCTLAVTGADNHTSTFPNGNGNDGKSVCPVTNNWPTMGTFEFASFADSGSLTFTVNGYSSEPVTAANLCTTGSLTVPADGTITTMQTLTMGAFATSSNCMPPSQ